MQIKSPITEYYYLGITFIQMEVSQVPNNYPQRKQEHQYLVKKRYLEFNKLPVAALMPCFFLFYGTALWYWVVMTELVLRNGKTSPLKNLIPNFTKILLV